MCFEESNDKYKGKVFSLSNKNVEISFDLLIISDWISFRGGVLCNSQRSAGTTFGSLLGVTTYTVQWTLWCQIATPRIECFLSWDSIAVDLSTWNRVYWGTEQHSWLCLRNDLGIRPLVSTFSLAISSCISLDLLVTWLTEFSFVIC